MSRIDVFETDSVSDPGVQASSAVHRVVEAYLAHRLGAGASGMFLTPFRYHMSLPTAALSWHPSSRVQSW